jgi:hypothetical protein
VLKPIAKGDDVLVYGQLVRRFSRSGAEGSKPHRPRGGGIRIYVGLDAQALVLIGDASTGSPTRATAEDAASEYFYNRAFMAPTPRNRRDYKALDVR